MNSIDLGGPGTIDCIVEAEPIYAFMRTLKDPRRASRGSRFEAPVSCHSNDARNPRFKSMLRSACNNSYERIKRISAYMSRADMAPTALPRLIKLPVVHA
jgi:hypothetical protein